MSARLHIDHPLMLSAELPLPASASRHVQVLRLQPGAPLTLFDGLGGEWAAEVLHIGRKTVTARVLAHHPVARELATHVTLAIGMPANERMDWLVEKATELGVAAIQPLVCERSVLRLAGERAERKAAHWQAIAVAACEQSGRNRVPRIAAPLALRDWLATQRDGGAFTDPTTGSTTGPTTGPTIGPTTGLAAGSAPAAARPCRLVLSLAPGARGLWPALAGHPSGAPVVTLSGPEGGLSLAETAAAEAAGFAPVTLGTRVLRADTAPLALLATLAALETTA